MKTILGELRTSVVAVMTIALIVCGAYPVLVWIPARVLFPHQTAGSLIVRDGNVIGSELLAQAFTGPQYFHPRPSAAGDGYDASSSGGSNLGPTSKRLHEVIAGRIAQYRQENGLSDGSPVPADAVTASASGLDPHISIKNAEMQASRVAEARGLTVDGVTEMIRAHTEGPDLGVLGDARVNVLRLNLALDGKR
ncbi:MAG: potassium-transporting ATPase subunit KdpC [Thermodesulfobacteriota bacterium]